MDCSRQKNSRQNLNLGDLQFSCFLVEKFQNKKVALLHCLNPYSPVIIDRRYWFEFKSNPDKYRNTKLFTKLCQTNLLIKSDAVDKKELKKTRLSFLNCLPNTPGTLYLILTEKCNLQCKYCPFPNLERSKKPHSMSTTVVKKGINFWAKAFNGCFEPKKTYYIIFYGGEPLLNIKVLRVGLSHIQFLKSKNKLPSNLKILLDTNGLLLTKKLALFLKSHQVEITIALDDFSETNDLFRIDLKKRGTVKKVLEMLKMLKKLKVAVSLSTALTPQNLDKIKNFPRHLKRYGIKSFGLNIIKGDFFSPGYQKKAAKTMRDFLWSTKEKGIVEFQTHRRFLAFNSKNFHSCNCGGFGEHLVIHPQGEIGSCPWTTHYLLGNVFNDKNYSTVKKNNFFFTRKKDLPLYNKECLGCLAISICGGRCIWAEDQARGKDKSFCQLSRALLDSFIWKYGVKLNNEKRAG